jgi:hypothetical protein
MNLFPILGPVSDARNICYYNHMTFVLPDSIILNTRCEIEMVGLLNIYSYITVALTVTTQITSSTTTTNELLGFDTMKWK